MKNGIQAAIPVICCLILSGTALFIYRDSKHEQQKPKDVSPPVIEQSVQPSKFVPPPLSTLEGRGITFLDEPLTPPKDIRKTLAAIADESDKRLDEQRQEALMNNTLYELRMANFNIQQQRSLESQQQPENDQRLINELRQLRYDYEWNSLPKQ